MIFKFRNSVRIFQISWLIVFSCLVFQTARSAGTCSAIPISSLSNSNMYVGSIAWSPDGKYIAAIFTQQNNQGNIVNQGLDILNDNSLEQVTEMQRSALTSVLDPLLWSPDSKQLAIGDRNGSDIELLDSDNWKATSIETSNLDEVTQRLVWSTNGNQLGVVTYQRQHHDSRFALGEIARIWNIQKNNLLTTFNPELIQVYLNSYDLQWYAAARSENDNSLKVIRLDNNSTVFEVNNVYLVDFSTFHEKMYLASVRLDTNDPGSNLMQVWDIDAKKDLLDVSGGATIAFSKLVPTEGKLLLIIRTGARSWMIRSLDESTSLSVSNYSTVVPSPNGKYLAAVEATNGGSDATTQSGNINIFDLTNKNQIALIPNNSGSVSDLAWSPDSQQIAVTGIVGTLSLWSLKSCS